MSNYQVINGMIGGQDVETSSSTQEHQLGLCIKAVDVAQATDYGVSTFIYLKGFAGTLLGSFVSYKEDDYSTTLLAEGDIGQVAIAMVPTGTDSFGWYQCMGKGVGLVAASFADNSFVYATGLDGTVDDFNASGDERIKQCRGASAIDTPGDGLAEFELTMPFMDNGQVA